MKNIYEFRVHFGDTDAAGIVYYPNYYRWMDQATHEFFRKKNLSPSKLQKKKNIIIPLVETGCKFYKPLFYEDIVQLHSKMTIEKNKILKLEHRFIKNNELIAKGFETRLWTKKTIDGLQSVSMSDEIKKLLLNE